MGHVIALALALLAAVSCRSEDARSVTLHSGASMPIVGLGTWQVTDPSELERALDAALEAGYRHIDTATVYKNEELIGKVLKRWLDSGKVKREDLFITTKLPFYGMRAEDVPFFLNKSVSALQSGYVDMYLVHVPFGTVREPWDANGKFKENFIDNNTDHLAIWKAMEAEVAAGRAKAIGVSNFNERQIQRILDNSVVPPSNLQVELHLYMQQRPLVSFCQQRNVSVTAYSPLGSPGSKWLFQQKGTPAPDLLGHEVVKKIAEQHNKTAAQVLLRHTMQRGVIVIPKSTHAGRIQQNIDIFDFTLNANDQQQLDALDRGNEGRLVDMKMFPGIEHHPEYPWN